MSGRTKDSLSENEWQQLEAMKFVLKWEKNPEDVSKSTQRENRGIDIRSDRGTIEVKSSRDKNRMLPDAHGNEFDADLNLIADYLYLVRFEDRKIVEYYRLTREEVGNNHKPIKHVRFAPSLQTALKNGAFPNRLREEAA